MDPLQSFLAYLSPSRAKSPAPPTKSSQIKSPPTPQTTKSRFRRRPPPELPLQSHKLSSLDVPVLPKPSLPPVPQTESSSSLAAPSVPSQSPLRGVLRPVGSFSSPLDTYQDASHSGSTLGLVPERAHSVISEAENQVQRSTSMWAVGEERSAHATTSMNLPTIRNDATHELPVSSPANHSPLTKLGSSLVAPPSRPPSVSNTPVISGSDVALAQGIDELSSSSPGAAVTWENFSITADTPVDDIISYFERVAKLDNYTSKLNHDQPPTAQRRGGTACVYRIATTDNTHLAVKCIFMQPSADKDKTLKRSARELEVWSRLKHKNILPLLGLAKYQNHIAMVSTWMSLGCVIAFVKDRPDENRYLLSKQVVDAVAYLHTQEIVHGDIKGDNVLMSDDGKPMLTDFGLTIINKSHLILSTTDGGGGSWRWMAPELLGPDGCRSKEADVYALGMTVLEILTGEPPFVEMESLYEILDAVRRQRKTPRRPECLTPPSPLKDAFWAAMTKCWAYEPARRAKMAEVEDLIASNLDEGRQRRKLIKAILESGKAPSSGVVRINLFRGRSSNDTEAQADLVKLEKRVEQGADAANAMAEHVAGWANELTAGAVQLLAWSRAFARVVDLDVLLGGDPQGGSEAVRAFTTVAASLEDLSRELVAMIKDVLVPQLQRLADTAQEPLLLLAHMHTYSSTHQTYLALATQLQEELPRYVDMFERAFGIIVLRLSGWQARYFQEAQRMWGEFWVALSVDGEFGTGESAAVETVRIWWTRWEATARHLARMSIVTPDPDGRVYTRQLATPTSGSASWDYIPSYSPNPSALSGIQQSAASSPSGKGHSRATSINRTQHHNDPLQGMKSQKGGTLRRAADKRVGEAVSEKNSAHSSSSRIQHPVLYTAAAIHPFNPETEATHLGLPFLMLRIGDTLDILVEAGHPSEHSNLPIPYDDAPDCLLAARNEDSVEGWVLASYLMPLP